VSQLATAGLSAMMPFRRPTMVGATAAALQLQQGLINHLTPCASLLLTS
jgi:hypothetical protein